MRSAERVPATSARSLLQDLLNDAEFLSNFDVPELVNALATLKSLGATHGVSTVVTESALAKKLAGRVVHFLDEPAAADRAILFEDGVHKGQLRRGTPEFEKAVEEYQTKHDGC